MRNYLVVANQTLAGEHLIEEVARRTSSGPSMFHVVVPAAPNREQVTWSEGEALAIAQQRLDAALQAFRALGVEVDGEVGDGDPLLAIADALADRAVDEIILSTLPPGLSRWLALDLPSKVRARFDIPVTHVIGEAEPVSLD